MLPDEVRKSIPALVESTNTLSGAMYKNAEILKSPIENLVNSFNKATDETTKLTKALVFWTKIMAFAVIGQIIAIIITKIF